jgi:hypothetical protein
MLVLSEESGARSQESGKGHGDVEGIAHQLLGCPDCGERGAVLTLQFEVYSLENCCNS